MAKLPFQSYDQEGASGEVVEAAAGGGDLLPSPLPPNPPPVSKVKPGLLALFLYLRDCVNEHL